ncbi:MAG: alpha-L-fucosidase [Defluviitaleaceae bacterium]|nr:alpha-L-fucosidase [Defluviitaleaceae bacterium]
MATKPPRQMTGAELRSMLKSSVNFKSLGGVKCEGLKLTFEDMQWWRDAKIGMFFHWGLYSILGRGEWVYHNEKLPKAEYEGLAHEFEPQDFSMTELTSLATDFGAKYMVMVTRHHDGFALWDSPGSYEQFTTMATASKRDFVREYSEACQSAGLKVGFYYSPMDWRFPGYFDPKGLPENAALMKKQCYDQVEELCTSYGPVDILWYDGGWLNHSGSDTTSAWFWEPEKLNSMVRKHQPKAVINPRSGWEGDFYCDEGSHPISGGIIPVPWEKNMCINSGASWGWMEDDPVTGFDDLVHMLVNVICRDGNWLVNVAPDRNGKLSVEVVNRVKEIGAWIKANGESIYNTRGGVYEPVDGVFGSTRSTTNKNHMYLHITDLKAFADIVLPTIPEQIISANLLDGTSCAFTQSKITLPDGLPSSPDTIVKLIMNRDIIREESEEIYFTRRE